MSVSAGSPFKASDYNNLKARVRNEMGGNRRGRTNGTGQWQSYGSMSGYAGSGWDFSTVPNTGVIVYAEHADKNNNPIRAVYNWGHESKQNSIVTASDFNTWEQRIASLEGCPANQWASSGCGANCTGLCNTGCYSNCSSCTGSCSGSCYGSCSGSCQGSCQGSCTGSCTGGCASMGAGCGTSCHPTCSTNCTDRCAVNCTGANERGG